MSAGERVHNDPGRPAFGYQRPAHGYHSLFDAALRRKHDAEAHRNAIGTLLADMLLDGTTPDKYWLASYARLRAEAEYAAAVYQVEAEKVRAA